MADTFYGQIVWTLRLTNRDPAEGGESVLTESERAFLNRMYGTYARTLLVYSYPEVAVCLDDTVIGLAPGTAMCSRVLGAWS